MTTPPANAAGMKVLVVDDAPEMQLYLGELLKKWGFEVALAGDGLEACEQLESGEIRLVICDWVMPRLSGVELCRAIRAAPLPHYVYVILLTSRTADNDLLEGMAAGADDFLTKPFKADELHARIKAAQRVLHLENTLDAHNRALAQVNRQLQQSHDSLRRDLEAAAVMQHSMLPSAGQSQNLQLQSLFRPAAVVAGDMFSYRRLDDRHLAFYHIDVAGHGVRSAMLSFTLGKVLSGTVGEGSPVMQPDPARPGAERITAPATVIAELNRRFQDNDEAIPYFTMLYGVINAMTGRVRMCQAGHPNPLLVSRKGDVKRLGFGGFPVGLLPTARYEDIEFSLRPGDRLVCYSDGITECMDPRQQCFGTERLVGHLLQSRRRPLPESLAELGETLQLWRGDQPFEDDISLLAIEFRPAPAEDTGRSAMPDRPVPVAPLPTEPPRTTP